MSSAQKSHQSCPDLSVMLWKQDNTWHQEKVHPTKLHVTDTTKSRCLVSAGSRIVIIFAEADHVRECPLCRYNFTDAFQIPELWWTQYCRNSNGYFGSQTTRGTGGNITGLVTWWRFLVKEVKSKLSYEWHKINVFTQWFSDPQQMVAVVFDAPGSLVERMPHPLLDNPAQDPFWIHTRILEEVIRLQDIAVWSVRGHVRAAEEGRPRGKPSPDYSHMHDLARHAIHILETLDLAIKTTGTIIRQSTALLGETLVTEQCKRSDSQNVYERLLFFEHMLESLRCRAISNKERLQNEIQLCFNTVAEYDAAISLEIGRATRSDSEAMKTIAFLTLAFLPATFISALFSMSFFDYDAGSGSWSVSNKLWVYWAIAIPITAFTIGSWYFWQRSLPNVLVAQGVSGLHWPRRSLKQDDGLNDNQLLRTDW